MKHCYAKIIDMARPAIYDDALRRRLLEATLDVVRRAGVDAVSLREVARDAGTSTSAVYALFGGRTELLVAVVEDAFASFGRAQAAAEAEGLVALGYAYREWALANPDLYRLMFGDSAINVMRQTEPACMIDAMAPLRRSVAALVPEAEPATVGRHAVAIWAQVHGCVSLQLSDVIAPNVDASAVFDDIITTIAQRFVRPE